MAEFTHFGHTSIKTEDILYYRREDNVVRVFLRGDRTTPIDVPFKDEIAARKAIKVAFLLDAYPDTSIPITKILD